MKRRPLPGVVAVVLGPKDTAATGILPCPFCGSIARAVARPHFGEDRVECQNPACEIAGPGRETRADGIAAWNARSAAACDPQALERVFDEIGQMWIQQRLNAILEENGRSWPEGQRRIVAEVTAAMGCFRGDIARATSVISAAVAYVTALRDWNEVPGYAPSRRQLLHRAQAELVQAVEGMNKS